MDDATETMEKNCQGCVVNQPLDKYTPLQPTPLPLGPWVKGAVDLVFQSMENQFWLISIIIRPIQKHTFHKRSLHVKSSWRLQMYSLDLASQRKWFLTTKNSFSAEGLKPSLNAVEYNTFVCLHTVHEATENQ